MWMRLLVCLIGVLAIAAGAASQHVSAPPPHREGSGKSKRVALVIGNGAYRFAAPLSNPLNDAADVAELFENYGYQVIKGFDLDKPAMDRTIREFARALRNADAGVFYYAGHGLQVGRQNYLVPVDARLEDATGLDFEMVRLDLVHYSMERETKTNILFLDACRDNPLSRNLARAMGSRSASIGQGLAPIQSGFGTLIAYSTQPDNVAADGTGRNSPFTESLVRRAKAAEGNDLSAVLIEVRNDVMAATNNRQVPWEHSALTARFYLSPEASKPQPQNYDKEMEILFWNSVKEGRDADLLQGYLERFPNGVFVPLAKKFLERHQEAARLAAQTRAAQEEQEAALARAEELKRKVEAAEEEKREREAQAAAAADMATRKRAEDEARRAQEAARLAEEKRKTELELAEKERTRLEALKANEKKVAEQPEPQQPPTPAPDRTLLVRTVQTELQRVGCYSGSIDGDWGGRSKSALQDFARSTNLKMDIEDVSPELLRVVAGHAARACLPTCSAGENLVNGKCVQKVARPTADTPKKPSQPKDVGSGGLCMTQGGSTSVGSCGDVPRTMGPIKKLN
jgi:uncharacterized caspase-like protein